jgi:cytochrome c
MHFPRTVFLSATLASLVIATAPAAAAGDPVRGKTLFTARCASCHSVVPGQKRLGPNLSGVVGRKAGSLPDYVYSPAMQKSGLTWNAATLDAYLASPRGKVPNTKMAFMGVPKEDERADIVAYLSSLSK